MNIDQNNQGNNNEAILLLQQMQQMQAQIMVLQQLNQLLFQTMQNNVAAAPTPIPRAPGPAPKNVKVPVPDVFGGKREKVEPFICQCNLVFQGNTVNFRLSMEKIGYALSLMRGGMAQEWAGIKMDAQEAACTGLGTDPFADWACKDLTWVSGQVPIDED